MEHAANHCPDEQALGAFVRKALSSQDSDRIREHLDLCDACRIGIMAGLSRSDTEPAAFGTNADNGMRLGHFKIVGRLGAGGMGVVYEAIDERLGRNVALKLLHGEHDESQLLVEARAMARVRHPSVLTVFEVGHFEGSVYLVTELIRGTTLRDHVKRTRPALPVLLELYARAAEGLAAAHAHGVMHRDFKPDNVLVEVGVTTRVLVADFGLATATLPGQLADGSGVAGTPAYMAPEQLQGRALDARVDVFAFCVSLWEALFGARPFAGQSLAEMRTSIHVPPRRPKTPALPRPLRDLLDRGLDHDPALRPSLAEIIVTLRPRARRTFAAAIAVLAIAGVVAAVTWPRTHDLGAACRTAPTPASTTAGWQQRAVAAGVPAWVQHRIATTLDAREREVIALQQATCAANDDDARRAWIACRRVHGVEESALAGSVAVPWHSYDRLDEALDLPWPAECTSKAARLDAIVDPADPHELTALDGARGALARGRLAALSGEPARWRTELDRARHAIPAVRAAIEVDALLDEAAYSTSVDSRMRISILEHGVEAAERGGYVTATARLWLALAIARGAASDDNASIDIAFSQASWSIDRAGDPPMLRARWHSASAARAYQRSDLADADRHARAAAALAGDDPRRKHFAATALVAAAAAHADYAGERTLLETLLADPSIANATDNRAEALHSMYAECLYHLGELGPARAEAERAIAISRATVGDRDPQTASALVIRGMVELDEGHAEDCVRTTEAAIAILVDTVGRDHPRVGSALNLRSSAYAALEDWTRAIADAEAAAQIFETHFGPRSEEAIFAHLQIGGQARMLHELDRARAALTRALDDARVTFGPEDPRTADVERSLAAVVDRDAARLLLEHALAVHEHAHTDAAYLAECQGALAMVVANRSRARSLARTALAAWRDVPGRKPEYDELAAWLDGFEHGAVARR